MDICRYLDHAVLKPDMTPDEVKAAIQLGIDYRVKTVCVRPCDIALALSMCKGTETEVSCVLDFPHGCGDPKGKAMLSALYADMGVQEIDMVMNYGHARGGRWDLVEEDIRGVVEEAHKRGVIVKVIFETCELTIEQIKRATQASIDAGADFVKTSTGFAKSGASVEAVAAMLEAAQGRIKVKPSGGIRDYATAKHYVDMGAQRLGTGFGSAKPICDGQGSSNSDY